jgi:putative transposase
MGRRHGCGPVIGTHFQVDELQRVPGVARGPSLTGSIRSSRVIEVQARLISVHGAPQYLRSDHGPEFVATALLRWLARADIETALIEPGKLWQNDVGESLNGKFRDECLSLEWFRNRTDATIVIESRRRH